ncbi:TonB-dependent receptor [Povalibacter sp.]|uniref:TonB-dependent receptor n=1 Tax=Povalibacter sp. TaxID=1962978 RepID=UPI002F4040D0
MRVQSMSKVTSSLFLASLCAATPVTIVHAQESSAGPQLEEITVTARRREENLMQVPLAISALGSADIENIGLKDIIELSAFTPGLYASVGGNGRADRSTTRLTFRGLSVASGLSFIDGAPYAGSRTPDITDVERVEVLKGPQSAYFGRSTFAGAVNFVSKAPADTFQGRVKAEATSYDGSDIQLSLEGPLLGDALGVRVTARQYSFGGYYENGGDPSSRMGAESTKSITAAFLSEPTDKLTIRSLLGFTVDNDGIANTAALKAGSELTCNLGGTGGAYWCGELPGVRDLDQRTVLSVNDRMDPFTYNELIDNAKGYPVTFDPRFNDKYGFKRETSIAHLKADYEFESGLSLSSTSAWHSTKFQSINDQLYRDGRETPNPLFGVRPFVQDFRQFTLLIQNEVEDFSQELRLTTSESMPLRGTIGVNYFRQWGPKNTNSGVSPTGRHTGSQTKNKVETPAVFGGVYWDPIDVVTLGFEARYQWDKIEQQAVYPNVGPLLSDTFTSFAPRFTIDYKFAPNSLAYALFSRGYQPGGFNTALVGQPQSIVDQIAQVGSNITYRQEQLENYEIGYKTTWFDNRLRTILALYYSDWLDGQVSNEIFVTRPDNTLLSTSITQNIGEVNLRGIELEAEFAVSDGFTLSGTFNYAKNEIKSYLYVPGGVKIQNKADVSGNRLHGTPELSWTLSPTYTHALNDSYDWFARLDYRGRSKIYVDPTNHAWIAPVNLLNVRAGISNDNLRLEAYIDNLTNDDNISEGVRANDVFFSNSVLNEIRLGLPDKRTIGLSLSYDF